MGELGTLKYLYDYNTLSEAKYRIGLYFEFYNKERIHQSLNYQTPEEVYHGSNRMCFGKEKRERACEYCISDGKENNGHCESVGDREAIKTLVGLLKERATKKK